MTQVVAAAGAWAQAAAPGYGGVAIQANGALGIMYRNSAADPGGVYFNSEGYIAP